VIDLGTLKNVVLMTSCIVILGTTDDETQKLYVINLYNFTMGKYKSFAQICRVAGSGAARSRGFWPEPKFVWSRNLSGAGAGKVKNDRLRQPCKFEI